MEQLQTLMAEKTAIETQITKVNEQIQIIQQTKQFENGLVDAQGFPRQDIDFGELSNFRNLKRRRAELSNDHKALMKQVQAKLFQYHSTLPQVEQSQREVKSDFTKNKGESSSGASPKIEEQEKQLKETQNGNNEKKHTINYLTPFAIISLVKEGSAAQQGGLKVGDLVSEFGQVNIYTPNNVKQIPGQILEEKPIKVVIMRKLQKQSPKNQFLQVYQLKDKNSYAKLSLMLTPIMQHGKGLIGCKIDPLTNF